LIWLRDWRGRDHHARSAGWTESGVIPNYALMPGEKLCDTAVFWKRLDR
jgi:hypothetical protein